MSAENFVPLHQVDAKILHWMSVDFDLQVMLEEKSLDHQHRWDSSSGEHECLQKISG